MTKAESLKHAVLEGKLLTEEEALQLVEADLEELCKGADEIRKHFCGDAFDICTIINGKSGKCSENCKYCAQSAYYKTEVETYPLLPAEKVLEQAKYNDEKGVLRYSIVTSGRCLNDQEVERVCEMVKELKKETNIAICGSFGLLSKEQFSKLKEAGVTRVHNNLESSRAFFKEICTTHTYDDKLKAIQAAKRAGLNVCSGGIMGLGETMEDRISMVTDIREMGIRSIPVNMLNPVPGTPYENNPRLTNEEMRRIVAIFRYLVPDASIRLAGGRGLLPDKGRACFCSGANAAISGDMLTTQGITIEKDMAMLKELGYTAVLWNE
ncbi:biotin synthase BioB [[Clostridium] polysaccharolyticum]|uniref:Biotin synthase n=1 Tax=[Clostridium] polysaccharolyticum TaxID=29364 RepID=A0A1I0B7Q0_9FIRM|nr:biotin synthase BioB [[Clostridium] polysaccharolyticum]SET02909.1 biotin synthase [[Clostridium] polysaccharolyticum]